MGLLIFKLGGENSMSEQINTAIMRLSRRAESYDREHLVSTFVDVGPLFTMLSNPDHQILYGRRGTGKTHALSFLANYAESRGDVAIQIDMRTVGSSGGIYSDPSLPLSERATRLIVDTLAFLHDQLLTIILNDDNFNLSLLGPILDKFADSITNVSVVGTVSDEETINNRTNTHDGINIGYNKGLSVQLNSSDQNEQSTQMKRVRTGIERHRLHFGTVRTHLSQLVTQITPKRIWVLLDEWSEVPLDLQPYLADLLRRTLFTIQGATVKIAAIEQRCEFRVEQDQGGYIGIELGADAANSLNLDEYMVFENNSEKAKTFFAQLIFKHVSSFLENTNGMESPGNPNDFIRRAFTQQNSFDEFVRAAEGVPRDAINILGLAAQAAQSQAISIPNIRGAAKTWYNRNKEQSVTAKAKALDLLRWIIDEVIAHRRARAFLLKSDLRHELIEFLYDARILHVVKQGVSSHDLPGVRFNVYSIDYGCYVDLINTTRAPQGLFEIDSEDGSEFVEVPANDYRAIRRAILDLSDFENGIRAS